MAVTLTETEKLKCAQIIGCSYIDVNDKIFNLGESYITPAVETLVRTQLTRWETYGENFADIMPFPTNDGVKLKQSDIKADIRKNIANLLYMSDYVSTGSGQARLVRG